MPKAAKPPTTEIGHVSNLAATVIGDLLGWASIVSEYETNRDLAFPLSIETYRSMRKTDAHISAILQAITIPVRRFGWSIDPNGAREETVVRTARNFGLPVAGAEDEPIPRSRNRFNHDRHLASVVRNGLTFGWQMHEQVYTLTPEKAYDLRKLAERPQHTITDIKVAMDGGLIGIKQGWGNDAPFVPVERLVAYVWQQEAGSWVGESLLRPMYRPFKIKDRILRVGAINIERAGGIPWVEAAQGANAKELRVAKEFAQQFRVGEMSGGALPFGWQLKFAQAAGGNEAAEYVKLQNQEMSRAALAMFLDLGTTETGARALGEGFIDFFSLQLDTVAGWYAEITNEHVIEDFIDVNYGIDESAPRIVYTRDPNPELAIEALVQLVNAGLIVVDDDLEDVIRAKHKLPDADREQIDVTSPVRSAEPTAAPAVDPSTGQPVPEEKLAVAAAIYAAKDPDSRVTLPARSLRRLPNEIEIAAAMDLEALDEAWQAALDVILDEWLEVRAAQLDELADQINAASSLADLAEISVDADGAVELAAVMEDLVSSGVTAAIEEAAAQGVTLAAPKLAEVESNIRERAEFIAKTLADELSVVAQKAAARFDMDGDAVKTELSKDGLPAYVQASLQGALTNAQNEGRFAVIESADDEPVEIYASAILDANTCPPCLDNDGNKYDSFAAAASDFAPGFYKHCEGRDRCRCTPVAVYREGISAARRRDYDRNNVGEFGYKNKRVGGNKKRAKSSTSRNADRGTSRFGDGRSLSKGPASDADVEDLISNYRKMHGKDPSAAQVARLRKQAARRSASKDRGKGRTPASTKSQEKAAERLLASETVKRPDPVTADENNARVEAMGMDPSGWPEPGVEAKRILGDAADTRELHHDGTDYSAERRELHAKIIDGFLAGKAKPDGQPLALYASGGSGSGKGSIDQIDTALDTQIKSAVLVDPDEIKKQLPEYRDMAKLDEYAGRDGDRDPYAASAAHEESSDIAKMLRERAEAEGLSIYFDGTGNSDIGKFNKKLRESKKRGYRVKVVAVFTPTEESASRSITRAEDSGRMVPLVELRKIHKTATINFLSWRDDDTVDEWQLYSNDVARGESAFLIASGGGGAEPTIADGPEYERVEQKALRG